MRTIPPFIPEPIDEYAKLHTSREDVLLAELTRETWASAKLPQMQTGHVEGSLLRLLVQSIGARLVVEIGTFTGYSSLSMAAGLPDGGRIVTCDIDPEATAIAKRYWARSPHGHKIDLRMGPALETVATITDPVDLVFIDADKENYVNYWEAMVPKTRTGGLLVVDNVLWQGRVLNPTDKSDHAIDALNKAVRHDSRVEAVMLTVRDGVTVARKR